MDKFEVTPTDSQATSDTQPQKRAWITPTFEQVSLKQALNTEPPAPESLDVETFSS